MRNVVVEPVFSWGVVMVSFVFSCFNLISSINFCLDLTLELSCFIILDVYLVIGT